jgi:DNA polymerase-4
VTDLQTLPECEERVAQLFEELMAELAQKEPKRKVTKIFVKLKFSDFTRTTAERAGLAPTLPDFRALLAEAFNRTGKPVRLVGVGVRFAEPAAESAQLPLL